MLRWRPSREDYLEKKLSELLNTRKKQIVGLVLIGILAVFVFGTQLPVSSDVTIHVFITSAYPTFSVYLLKVDATGTVQESTLEALQVVPYQNLWQGASSNKYSSDRWTFIRVIVNNTPFYGDSTTLYGVFAVPKHMLLFWPSYCEVSATVLNNGIHLTAKYLQPS